MAKPKTTKLRRWTTEEIDFLKNNFATMTHKELGATLDRTVSAVCAKCFELGLYKKEYPWTEKELKFLQDNYNNMTYRQIAHELGRTLDAVRSKAAILGIIKDSYYCDFHYFKTIDTQEKAYWLGFIFADGWTFLSKETEAGYLGIELQAGDIGHLKKFNKSIGGNYKITTRDRKYNDTIGKYFGIEKDKITHLCQIRVFSRPFTDDLIAHGIIPNKSLVKVFPNTVPYNLMRHFIRGYFDGNGCVCEKNKRNMCFSFCSGSEKFITSLREELIKNEIYCSKIYARTGNNICFNFNIYSNFNNASKFYDYIYKDATIYLDRKFNKSTSIKNRIERKKNIA